MSVAKGLGLDDVDGPAMAAAGVAWQRWCHQEPDLAVVDDLLDLPDWTRRVSTATKDDLLARLSQLAQDHAEAAYVRGRQSQPGLVPGRDPCRVRFTTRRNRWGRSVPENRERRLFTADDRDPSRRSNSDPVAVR